jgi:hypothetical protein
LTNTAFDIKKYAQLPDDVTVAQKYGSYHNNGLDYFHSCGIMYIKESRIFYCVMTRKLDREKASEVVGTIVNKLYNYVTKTRNKLDKSSL